MLRLLAALTALAISTPGHAASDEPTAPPSPQPSAAPKSSKGELHHRFQVGLAVRAGSGFRVVAPKNEEYCGQLTSTGEAKAVCGGVYPGWFELSPSFGLTRSLELLVDLRFPLASPRFTTSAGLYVAPGLKVYPDPDGIFKFFLAGQVVFEYQKQDLTGADPPHNAYATRNAGLGSFDFGVRATLGVQFDIIRYVGLFVQSGVVFGFVRWINFLVDIGGGVQVRY